MKTRSSTKSSHIRWDEDMNIKEPDFENPKRHNKPWSVQEVLQLEREYHLLEWNTLQIAKKHQRSELSILYKLRSEEWIHSFEEARRV